MQIAKTLPKPQNWYDLETLCKKLWGDVWECPEIKKNGRQGQAQNGVNIYGIPKGETAYYGIQCKGKDEYSGKNFTTKEIDNEIEKAINFNPKLKKLYFATTAEKDTKIEEYIRKVNLKNIADGLFEVHLYCWGDIVELIFENRNTYNYYVNSLNFKDNYSAIITFNDSCDFIQVSPKFKKDTITKIAKTYEHYNPRGNTLDLLGASFGSRTEKINISLIPIHLKLKNTGINDITNFKLLLNFDENVIDIVDDNMRFNVKRIISQSGLNIQKKEKCVEIIPFKKILVGEEEYEFEIFFIRTLPIETEVKLEWKLLSSKFKTEGTLFIKVTPEIIEKQLTSETDHQYEIGKVIQKDIEDYWEYK